MPEPSPKRRSTRWSLRTRFDVPTCVRVLRCGALFIAAIMAAMADPLLPEFGRRASAISPDQAGLRAATAMASFTVSRRNKNVTFNFRSAVMAEFKADVLVLGAGMVGVGAALHLQQRGRDVILVDRHELGRGGNQFRQCRNDRVRVGVSLHVSPGFRTDPPLRPEQGAAGALQPRRSAELPAVAGALLSRLRAGAGASRCAGGDAADSPQPGRA